MTFEVPGFLKNLGEQVAVEAALGIVRGFLNGKIKNITPGDMYTAIQKDQDLWDITPDDMRGGGTQLKRRFGKYLEKYQAEINTESVLKWLQKDRPDLYSTILNTPNGIAYIERQIVKMKYKILREL